MRYKVNLCSNAADYAEMRNALKNTVLSLFRRDRRFIGQAHLLCNAQYNNRNLIYNLRRIVDYTSSLQEKQNEHSVSTVFKRDEEQNCLPSALGNIV